MNPTGAEESAHRLGPTRARMLALLQDAGGPLRVQEVAGRLAMHPNSVRLHLDALAADGLAVRGREARSTPGRPRVTYAAAVTSPDVTRRRYRELAGVLADVLHDQLPDPAAAAQQTGRAWSRSLGSAESARVTNESQALDTLVDSLEEVGFTCRAVPDSDAPRLEITECPFLEVAVQHQDVVCAIHLGLMRGVLERVGAPIGVRDLLPLVAPSLCVAHLDH